MAGSGEQAERLVEERVRAALPAGARCYANVPIVAKTRATGPAHDAEADLVIVHPEHGVLVIETKAGEPRRDTTGHWFIGDRTLTRSPFKQAEDAKHDLAAQIAGGLALDKSEIRAGHAVAFPFADVVSLGRGGASLGPDAPRDIVLDAEACVDAAHMARALERVWAWWTGDGSRGQPLTEAQMDAIEQVLSPAVELRRLVRRDVDDGRDRLVMATNAQRIILNQHRSTRRLEIVGPAGSGKSLVAVEKAWRLALEGYRTLFVCFNSPLASAIQHELGEQGEPADRRPEVATFHRLCELLGARAATLPPKPTGDLPQSWWDETLPTALDGAIDRLPHERYHAVIVDEGQDFRFAWLASLQFLLHDGDEDVLWVFHDPGQALFRDDVVAELGLPTLELFEDYRSPTPVAKLAARFYHGPSEPYPVMEGGRAPTVVEAAPGRETLEEVRRQLHRLIEDEGVRPWNIAVLSGRTASKSEVWRQRRFGNVELWNGAIDDEGKSLALPSEAIPDEPPDGGVVRFESIRRFKGLERAVIILCELDETGDRFDQLLYTGMTRATAYLVIIAAPNLARRLGRDR